MEQEIQNRIATMLNALDALDWETVRASFGPRVAVDYTSLFGGTAETLATDTLLERWRGLLPGFEATQHLIGPVMVTSTAPAWRRPRRRCAAITMSPARRVVRCGWRRVGTSSRWSSRKESGRSAGSRSTSHTRREIWECQQSRRRASRPDRERLRTASIPEADPSVLRDLAQGTVLAAQDERPSLGQLQVCGVVDRQLVGRG